jgi:hypothetical protein
MSQTHIRIAQPEPPKTNAVRVIMILILSGLVLFCIMAVAVRLVDLWHEPAYITTSGQIEQTRIGVAYTRATSFGGRIYYRIEALVSYQIDGKPTKQWLVASPPTLSREMLLARTSQNPTKCVVYWTEGNPANVQCKIEDAWTKYPGLNP